MGRIRNLKPDYFRSTSLALCTRDARTTFQGLWCEADDAGRGIADPRILKGAVWPLDDDLTAVDISDHLDQLARTGHIVLYTVGAKAYFQVLNWEEHQAAAYRTGKSKHPAPPEPAPNPDPSRSSTISHDSPRFITLDGMGEDGRGEDDDDSRNSTSAPVDNRSSSSFDRIIGLAATLILEQRTDVTKPSGFLASTRKNLRHERGDEIRELIARGHSDEIVAEIIAGTKPPKPDDTASATIYGRSTAAADAAADCYDPLSFAESLVGSPEWCTAAVNAYNAAEPVLASVHPLTRKAQEAKQA
jgi:hypothetical protein